MKNKLLACALLSTSALVHAQSSVTLYGRIDTGLEYINGLTNAGGQHASRVRLESGNWGAGVWGLQGSEDIGGGTKVLFHLESYLDITHGTSGLGGSLFDRFAQIGVANPTYGTLNVGRALSLLMYSWTFDPFYESNWSSFSLVRGRVIGEASNTIQYDSPKFGGFNVTGQYSLSNASNWNGNGTTSQGRSGGLMITYTAPLFQLLGIYDEKRDPQNGKLDDVYNYSRGYTGAVNVFLGQLKISAGYQQFHADASPAANRGVTTLGQAWGGLTWHANGFTSLVAAVYHVNANSGGGNATIYTIGGQYNLSKRTFIDTQIAMVHNSSTANFGIEANPAGPGGQTGANVNDNPGYGHSQVGIYAGMQHAF
jgi:predicted porin